MLADQPSPGCSHKVLPVVERKKGLSSQAKSKANSESRNRIYSGIKRVFRRFHFDVSRPGDNEQVTAEEYLRAQTAASMLTAPSSKPKE